MMLKKLVIIETILFSLNQKHYPLITLNSQYFVNYFERNIICLSTPINTTHQISYKISTLINSVLAKHPVG